MLKLHCRQLSSQARSLIDFSDTKTAFRTKSFKDLLRGQIVFSTCQIAPIVNHADKLLKLSNKIFGSTITEFFIKPSYFDHFCAGEDERKSRMTAISLAQNGIGSILCYSAESDVSKENEISSEKFNAKFEAYCDDRSKTFEKATQAMEGMKPVGFNAIKISAICDPNTVQHASSVLINLSAVFKQHDTSNNSKASDSGYITVSDLMTLLGWRRLATGNHDSAVRNKVEAYFHSYILQETSDSAITRAEPLFQYQRWLDHIPLSELLQWHADVPFAIQPTEYYQLTNIKNNNNVVTIPLLDAVRSSEYDNTERKKIYLLEQRLERNAVLARALHVKLFLDAEHSYFQPAIDHLARTFARMHNNLHCSPVIFNTYQMYLVEGVSKLQQDMQRAELDGYEFAGKLVRGAYMDLERKHSDSTGATYPICATLQDTHDSYNTGVNYLLSIIAKQQQQQQQHKQSPMSVNSHVTSTEKDITTSNSTSSDSNSTTTTFTVGSHTELFIATHNQESIELAVAAMQEKQLPASTTAVSFAQLYGMKDNLTYALSAGSYNAYKYVPYGAVQEVIPYLIRRAHENAGVMTGAKQELSMLNTEVRRRLFG